MKSDPKDDAEDNAAWRNRPRNRVRHPCSVMLLWTGELCRHGGSVERDGKWYCYQHDPDRLNHMCSATNVQGDPCGRRGAVERDGRLFCTFHDPNPDPDEPRRRWQAAAEERDRKLWAAATVKATTDGVRVYLIREDVLALVRELLGRLPYKDVSGVMRVIDVLPEAPLSGREKILKREADPP